MAKALLGHVGHAPDLRLVSEVQRLRDRVRALEVEAAQLSAANRELSEQLRDLELHQEMLTLSSDRDLDVAAPLGQPALA